MFQNYFPPCVRPWQSPVKKIDHNVGERLDIVSPTLLESEVAADWRKHGGANKDLIVAKRIVEPCFRLPILCGMAEVDEVDPVGIAPAANENVAWFKVAVNVVTVMDMLQTINLMHVQC